MSSLKPLLVPALTISVMLLPLVLCSNSNLRCFYSPYITEDTRHLFKPVVTECPPRHLCFTARGEYGKYNKLKHHGCILQRNCDDVKLIQIKGAVYNTSYSCCDKSYCNSGTNAAANSFTVFVIVGILFFFMGL